MVSHEHLKACCSRDGIENRVAHLGGEHYLYQCPNCKTVWGDY